jgi:hypothetical protein
VGDVARRDVCADGALDALLCAKLTQALSALLHALLVVTLQPAIRAHDEP